MVFDQEVRTVSVLYADFIGFNKLAQIFQPEDMMAFLNRLYSVMEKPIEEHGGLIDKIIGDGIIVTFNAFEPVADHHQKAVNAALGIIKAVNQFAKEEEQTVKFGIGVATGKASCGPLGTSTFHPRTVIGPVVARVVQLCEKACSEDATTLFVDANTFHDTISTFEYQQIDENVFKVNIPIVP